MFVSLSFVFTVEMAADLPFDAKLLFPARPAVITAIVSFIV